MTTSLFSSYYGIGLLFFDLKYIYDVFQQFIVGVLWLVTGSERLTSVFTKAIEVAPPRPLPSLSNALILAILAHICTILQ